MDRGDGIERETLELDVLFVGAGPASLAGALRLAELAERAGQPLEIGVIDKSRELGDHGVSGAVLDPVALAELVPGWLERGCPVERKVTRDEVHFLTTNGSLPVPHVLLPPELINAGLHTISLGRFVKWLGGLVEEKGVYLFLDTCAVEVLYQDGRVAGVRTGDKGLGKDGERKGNFEPGSLLRAKLTLFGEGPRGTVTEDLIAAHDLRRDCQPQVYSLGCKEVIKVPGSDRGGLVMATLGYPLRSDQFGGGFLYEMADGHWSVGLVASLAWRDPGFDCFEALQDFKKHPLVQRCIRGGEVVSYGAKTIPEGGYFSIPRLYTGGAMLIGDSAGLVDVKRNKGIPHAMTSGMVAAGVAFEALQEKDTSAGFLARYWERLQQTWVVRDLWKRRHFRSSFDGNLYTGLARMMWRELSGGGPKHALPLAPDWTTLRDARRYPKRAEPRGHDPSVILDKLTAVYKSGTMHREDQPPHIRIPDPRACVERCIPAHGTAPCTHFCPAAVYELVGEGDAARIQINFSNCVHCKTCGILDPVDVDPSDRVQNIVWRAPAEGGPRYKGL